jgi:hypothetical protein
MRQAMVWYISQPLASASSSGSGVSMRTAPSVSSQYSRTLARSAAASALPLWRWTMPEASRLRRPPTPSMNTSSCSSPGCSSTTVCSAAHGSSAAPQRPDRPACGQRLPALARLPVAADEFGAVAGMAHVLGVEVEERHPAGKLGVVGIAREQRAADRVLLRHHVHAADLPRAGRPAPIRRSR